MMAARTTAGWLLVALLSPGVAASGEVEAFHAAIGRLEQAFVHWAERQDRQVPGDAAASPEARSFEYFREGLLGLMEHLPRNEDERAFLERKLRSVAARMDTWQGLRSAGASVGAVGQPFASVRPGGLAVVPVVPAGDCASATEIGVGAVSWDSYGRFVLEATRQDAWFRIPAQESATEGLRLHTGGSTADTVLTVHEWCGGPVVAHDDDSFGLLSELRFVAPSGEERWLHVEWTGDGRDRLVVHVEPLGSGLVVGTVVEDPSGVPLESVRVRIYTLTGSYMGQDYTDAGGAFQFFGLSTGTYRALTWDTDDHLDEVWDDHPCDPSCSVLSGDTFEVVSGEVTEIDFALRTGGIIRGTVVEEGGVPIGSGSVRVYSQSGQYLGQDSLSSSGAYDFAALAPGVYFVLTTTSGSTFLDEVWDDIPCPPNCTPTNGTPIVVGENETVSGIDFELARNGMITGNLSDNALGGPIPFARVRLYNSTGSYTGATTANSAGTWQTSGVDPGVYYAISDEYYYRNEVYDDVPCTPSCAVTSGTPIVVQTGAITSGIDFALDRLGVIEGRVTDAATGVPLPGVRVERWSAIGTYSDYYQTAASGHFEFDQVHPGAYFVVSDEGGEWIDQLYEGIPCPRGPGYGCSVVDGTPVAIDVNEVRSGIDLPLVLGGAVAGVVRDAATQSPLSHPDVLLYAASGGLLGGENTGLDGTYRVGGLPGGVYFAVTDANGSHLDEAWDDVPCMPCNPTTGSPILVVEGQTTSGIDFDLQLLGGISGVITGESGQALAGVRLHAWDLGGVLVGAASSNASGAYQIDTQSGWFFLSTENDLGLPEELWDDIHCPHGSASDGLCDPLEGTQLFVIGAQPVLTGIDFVLGPTIFVDGFESGDLSAWSNAVP